MELTTEQKEKVLEQARLFVELGKKIKEHEDKIAELSKENERVLEEIDEVKKSLKNMEDSLNLNEEGKVAYNKYVQEILSEAMGLK